MPKKYMTLSKITISEVPIQKYNIPPHSCLNKTFAKEVRNKCGWGCLENGGLNGLLVKMFIGATPWNTFTEVSHKTPQELVPTLIPCSYIFYFCIYI